jgi:type IV pilus assembly protein PilN
MTQINLLPWREQARQDKKIQFAITLSAYIVLTLIIVVIFHVYFNGLIRHNNARIAFLQTTLGTKQNEYSILRDKKQKQNLIETELDFLNNLHEKSFRAVNLMNELNKTIPSAITLEKLIREENKIILIGSAQSELQITLFLKNISKSPFFNQPVLTHITETPGKPEIGRMFELQVEQKKGKSS